MLLLMLRRLLLVLMFNNLALWCIVYVYLRAEVQWVELLVNVTDQGTWRWLLLNIGVSIHSCYFFARLTLRNCIYRNIVTNLFRHITKRMNFLFHRSSQVIPFEASIFKYCSKCSRNLSMLLRIMCSSLAMSPAFISSLAFSSLALFATKTYTIILVRNTE